MSDICIIPAPQSFAQPTKFQLVFDRVANTVFYCTSVNVPGVDLGTTLQPTPFIDLNIPGDKITMEPLTVTFLVDSKYHAWTDVHQWITGVGFPERFEQYKNLLADSRRPRMANNATAGIRPPYSDAALIIYSAKNNALLRVNFKDCYPLTLGSINLSYQADPTKPMVAQATFNYSYFTITRF